MGRTYSCWMLNCWCITWPVGFKRLIKYNVYKTGAWEYTCVNTVLQRLVTGRPRVTEPRNTNFLISPLTHLQHRDINVFVYKSRSENKRGERQTPHSEIILSLLPNWLRLQLTSPAVYLRSATLQQTGEKYVTRSFTICSHQILLWYSNQIVWHAWG